MRNQNNMLLGLCRTYGTLLTERPFYTGLTPCAMLYRSYRAFSAMLYRSYGVSRFFLSSLSFSRAIHRRWVRGIR